MSKLQSLAGVLLLLGVGYFDYWVWSNLFASGLDELGSLLGFGLLALVSFPVTILGGIIGLLSVLNDD